LYNQAIRTGKRADKMDYLEKFKQLYDEQNSIQKIVDDMRKSEELIRKLSDSPASSNLDTITNRFHKLYRHEDFSVSIKLGLLNSVMDKMLVEQFQPFSSLTDQVLSRSGITALSLPSFSVTDQLSSIPSISQYIANDEALLSTFTSYLDSINYADTRSTSYDFIDSIQKYEQEEGLHSLEGVFKAYDSLEDGEKLKASQELSDYFKQGAKHFAALSKQAINLAKVLVISILFPLYLDYGTTAHLLAIEAKLDNKGPFISQQQTERLYKKVLRNQPTQLIEGLADYRIVTSNYANIHTDPGNQYPVVGSFECGVSVEVIDKKGKNWIKVAAYNKGEYIEGWIQRGYTLSIPKVCR